MSKGAPTMEKDKVLTRAYEMGMEISISYFHNLVIQQAKSLADDLNILATKMEEDESYNPNSCGVIQGRGNQLDNDICKYFTEKENLRKYQVFKKALKECDMEVQKYGESGR